MKGKDNIFYPDMISEPDALEHDRITSLWNRTPFWIPVLLAVLTICTVFIARNVKQIKESSENACLTRTLLPEEEPLLAGMYYVRSLEGDGEIYASAEVAGNNGEYIVTIFSDYSPQKLEAIFLSDGSLHCDGVGEGKTYYKPSTGSINIVFTKEGIEICEFSK